METEPTPPAKATTKLWLTKLTRAEQLAACLGLGGIVAVLLAGKLPLAWNHSAGAGLFASLATLLFVLGFLKESLALCNILPAGRAKPVPPAPDIGRIRSLAYIPAVLVGALLTYWGSHDLGLGAVVSSALTGLCGALLFPDYAPAIYCGSFVGMSSNELFGSQWPILIAGSLAGVLFYFARSGFTGLGGKLGTIAFASTMATALVLHQSLPAQSPAVPVLTVELPLWICAGTLLTWYLVQRRAATPVLASSAVGLAFGLILPALYGSATGYPLAIAVFCSSFAGMSGKNRLPTPIAALLTGLLCAGIYLFATPLFGGTGGKLGTIAFASTVGFQGLAVCWRAVRRQHAPAAF